MQFVVGNLSSEPEPKLGLKKTPWTYKQLQLDNTGYVFCFVFVQLCPVDDVDLVVDRL